MDPVERAHRRTVTAGPVERAADDEASINRTLSGQSDPPAGDATV